MTFLSTIKTLGVTITFLLYMCSTLIAFVFILTCLPETLGKTAEEIAKDIPQLPAFRALRAMKAKSSTSKGQGIPTSDDKDTVL